MDQSQQDRQKPLVLIVDDDMMQRVLAREALEGSGFDVEDAEHGRQALQIIGDVFPDLVILDVVMPELDGFAVCTLLRNDSALMHIPVLMVTGLDDGDSIERAFKVGATDFQTKPINWPLLGYRVKYMLRASKMENQLRDARERLHHLLTSSPAVIHTCEPQKEFLTTYVSENIERQFGLDPNDFNRDPNMWQKCIHPDDVTKALESNRRVVEDGSGRAEYRIRRNDGVYRWVSDERRLIRDENGSPEELLGCLVDITEVKEQQEQLEYLALYDSLTDLPNRTLLMDRLTLALQLAKREDKPFAILLLDLEKFKDINDAFGHHIGDMVLRAVAQRLVLPLRKTDTIARLGGDEFAVVLPAVSGLERAQDVAQRILNGLEAPFEIGELSLNVGITIGIALYPEHAETESKLLECADVAMFAAKPGDVAVMVYDKKHDEGSVRRLTLSGELRRAIEGDELELHYQPKIDMTTGRVCGAEALARWFHATQGFIPPDQFISHAERIDLIGSLTYWAFDKALGQLSLWLCQGYDVGIAVNISAIDLQGHKLPDQVKCVLRKWKIEPQRLTLEITESTIMRDPMHALKIATELHDIGVRLSIDDFGTGYSSLAYLKRLPVDELKIDRSFVMHMGSSENDAVIVRSVVDLAHNLGLKVVAEGIENEHDLDLLRELGCDVGQGFSIGHPMTIEDWNTWEKESPFGRNAFPAHQSLKAARN